MPGSDTLVIGMAGAGGEPDEAQGFLHLEEAGEAQRRGDGTHSHINGLGRQPGELYVGIPALGGGRGGPEEGGRTHTAKSATLCKSPWLVPNAP